jgi:UDP:flavonoid glycosyltransferase YjiC (YdhE family)
LAHFALVTWAGGGNVTVALAIGDTLAARGHAVTIIGPTTLQAVIEGRGHGYRALGGAPPRDPTARSEYLVEVVGSRTAGADLRELIDGLRPDALVIDCNLSWAIELRSRLPTAVLVHTAMGVYLPAWQLVIDAANERRAFDNLSPYARAIDAWSSHDRLLVASVPAFDRPPVPLPSNAVYVGWVRSPDRKYIAHSPRIEATGDPIVLISYSTDPLQNHPERVQSALDALADLPVQVVATTSGIFAVDELSVPDNATAVDYLPHDLWMPMAAVVVGHAGHGTTMAALYHGVPLVCVPGLGRDQVPIAARVAELGLGLALTDNAASAEIRAAVTHVVGDSSYKIRARLFRERCRDFRGAGAAVAELEGLVARSWKA